MNKKLTEHLYNDDFFYHPQNPKFQCTLQANGANFDPDSFLEVSNISHEKKLFKGIIGLPNEIKEKIKGQEFRDIDKEGIENRESIAHKNIIKSFSLFETPFLLIRISKAKSIVAQIEDATAFLKYNLDDLIKLGEFPNVETFMIQFLTEDFKKSSSQTFPEEFNDLCSKIGLHGITFG